ncbi:alcohol dehydrogenase [Nitzschia inconspicua]|uniref:Alcohol dehydrogenase n=1 Tax=Nitzschia inconspicua TaxID=303405 RepID=A0A9K3L370_9STRA|nr:alcohol dehydrogenase [Nitzschia inconspicua]
MIFGTTSRDVVGVRYQHSRQFSRYLVSSHVHFRSIEKKRLSNALIRNVASVIVVLATVVSAGESRTSWPTVSSGLKLPPLLVLDVDNTLYNEQQAEIERQIVQLTHEYCQKFLNISPQEADQLFITHGSTIEGLRQLKWKDLSEEVLQQKMEEFYCYVYNPIDPSRLLIWGTKGFGSASSTGYSHDAQTVESEQKQRLARLLLKHYPHPLSLASNSPSWHVEKVMYALGLGTLRKKSTTVLFTPDRISSYPTKHQPLQFFSTTEDEASKIFESSRLILFEDSLHNLQRIQEAFPEAVEQAYHIMHHHNDNDIKAQDTLATRASSVSQALLYHYGLLDPTFKFSDVQYLQAKNKVDAESIHVGTWNRVMDHLHEQSSTDSLTKTDLWIVDVGAGLLSVLDIMLHGNSMRGLSSLDVAIPVRYTAYESNKALYQACHERLLLWGFQLIKQTSPTEMWYRHGSKPWEVQLLLRDFVDPTAASHASDHSPNLIVGCCFADLMDPQHITVNLIRSFGLMHKTTAVEGAALIYFPITFAGVTQFLPPVGFQKSSASTDGMIPSDTAAFRTYSDALESELGHNLDVHKLVESMQDHGAALLAKEPSNWHIDPVRDPYLYETMLYFFGTTAGPQILKQGYNAGGWLQRARSLQPAIETTNLDLLFSIGAPKKDRPGTPKNNKRSHKSKEILFTGPFKVEAVKRHLPQLGPRQIIIQSSCSLISSGTELKIFRGDFETDMALDVNIKDMDGDRMSYPLSYGYSLVGEVVECGSDVDPCLLGKLVFTFSPHATYVVTDVDAIQIVPKGIHPLDAIFMPSVETSLSLVHDAHVRLGENVAIYGQGLIGLLVTALLGRQANVLQLRENFGTVTTFDRIPDRLAASAAMGASEALFPGGSKGPFDVSIEVSGNGNALQAAIDCTRDGGRIIIGSWYGNSLVQLKLGIDFHRSHKSIQTSQVSEIPASLSGLWTKQRRFDLTWELVRELRPSRLLTKTLPLDKAQAAYEALDGGTEIAVAFDYTLSSDE